MTWKPVVTGLEAPTGVRVNAVGTVFVTQRNRGLTMHPSAGEAIQLVAPADVRAGDASSVAFLGLELDPGFMQGRRFVYMALSLEQGTSSSMRIVRARIESDPARVGELREILVVEGLATRLPPPGTEQQATASASLRFASDGYLYAHLSSGSRAGDAASPLLGKIVRIDREGLPPTRGVMSTANDKRVVAPGNGEPAGLAFMSTGMAMLLAERSGQRDRLSVVAPGALSGAQQVVQWPGLVPGSGLAAIERLDGHAWREWNRGFAAAFDRAQRVDLLAMRENGQVVHSASILHRLGFGFAALSQGPDGLYVATSGKTGGDEVWRVTVY